MLSAEQLNRLKSYCRSAGAPYYEVQVELVDHMAAMMEHQLAEGVNFEQAFAAVKKQFPAESLQQIVRAKEKVLLLSYLRLFIGCWKAFFTWPKLLILVSLYAFTWLITPYMNARDMVFIGHQLVALYGGMYLWAHKDIVRKNRQQAQHRMLSFRITYYTGGVMAFLLLLLLYLYSWNEATALFLAPLLKYFYPLFLLLVVSFYHVQVVFHQNLRQQFRHAFR
ncbi:hypothetical protein [Flavihumibacter sp. CACIAM 22H1]|uniref:hypothetical protein n=1 Tax=Flavihumibacter sp. CACIAM 22H1 TaxID=1812911 RepID=UPI0007A8E03F|nr:hypothetical protein [Flavihumibacter sp. CACIAM 22H1]KYP13075.1 MAG: hypothetical protein A1D16_07410 [Flavihumibacter sp. CACIAM 22H1]